MMHSPFTFVRTFQDDFPSFIPSTSHLICRFSNGWHAARIYYGCGRCMLIS